jgi:hypothetical protein
MSLNGGYCGKVGVKRGRKTHFLVGNSKMNFDTSNTRNYDGKKGGQAARLDPAIEKTLRTHHFKVEDRETKKKIGNPMYRTSHPWKLSIPNNI